jgi:hypothetical protein
MQTYTNITHSIPTININCSIKYNAIKHLYGLIIPTSSSITKKSTSDISINNLPSPYLSSIHTKIESTLYITPLTPFISSQVSGSINYKTVQSVWLD